MNSKAAANSRVVDWSSFLLQPSGALWLTMRRPPEDTRDRSVDKAGESGCQQSQAGVVFNGEAENRRAQLSCHLKPEDDSQRDFRMADHGAPLVPSEAQPERSAAGPSSWRRWIEGVQFRNGIQEGRHIA